MTAMSKLAKDEMRAEIASLDGLIASLKPSDALTKMSLEAKHSSLTRALASLGDAVESATASVALFFAGRPVVGSRSIDSRFGTAAISAFQDLVAKIQTQADGGLGKRGPIPDIGEKSLHITNVARGSFGFILEEVVEQSTIVASPLHSAVDAASNLLQSLAQGSEDNFDEVIAGYDERVLAAAGAFVNTLRNFGATARVVANEFEFRLSSEAVDIAVARAKTTTIKEDEITLRGALSGTLPESHMFEFRSDDDEIGTFRGRVDKAVDSATLAKFNRELSGLSAVGFFRRKRVFKDGKVAKTAYILENVKAAHPPLF